MRKKFSDLTHYKCSVQKGQRNVLVVSQEQRCQRESKTKDSAAQGGGVHCYCSVTLKIKIFNKDIKEKKDEYFAVVSFPTH